MTIIVAHYQWPITFGTAIYFIPLLVIPTYCRCWVTTITTLEV
jgi:hypothetical protein